MVLPPIAPDQPPMPLPPVMPAFAGPTPDDVLNLIEEEVTRIEAEVEADTKPTYPYWFKEKDWQRPDPAVALEYARKLHNEYGPLRTRFSDDIRFLFGDGNGHYESGYWTDASKWEKENLYHSSVPEGEHEIIVAKLGSIPPIYKPTMRRKADRDETADKTDFLYAIDAEAERRHVGQGNGPYRMDIVRSLLIYGRVISYQMFKTECDEGEIPIAEALIDPSTCCPVNDSHGLSHMIRVYRTTLADACRMLDYDGKMKSKLEAEKKAKKRDDATQVEVTEYWDRWWKLVWVDSVLIIGPTAHRLGRPPFVFQMGGLGLPAFVRDPGLVQSAADFSTYATSFSSTRDTAMPNKGVSHVHMLRYPVRLREAIAARMITHFRQSVKPRYMVGQTHIAEAAGVPEINSDDPNAITTYQRDQETIDILPQGSVPADSLAPITQLNGDDIGRVSLPASSHGIGEGINSGFAIENLDDNGDMKMMPHLESLRLFYQQRAEGSLCLFRDWGWMAKQGYEDRGKLYVAREKPFKYQDPEFIITPGAIKRTGYRVAVDLTRVQNRSLTTIANAMAIMNNIGLGNPVYFYELIGDPNPERRAEEDKYYRMLSDPALERIELIEYLRKNGEEGMAARLEAQAQPPADSGMMPTDQLSGGQVISPTTVQTQGMSMPQFNQPPGPVR